MCFLERCSVKTIQNIDVAVGSKKKLISDKAISDLRLSIFCSDEKLLC